MSKCHHTTVDGIQVHINADFKKLTADDHKAIMHMIKLAVNYTRMKQKYEEKNVHKAIK